MKDKKCNCGTSISDKSTYCSDCRKNKNRHRWKIAVRNRRSNIKKKAVDYKGGKCERCGYNKCLRALDFHHIIRKEKSFSIAYSGIYRDWDILKKELDKCQLLCANCHREIEEKIDILP